MPPAAALSTPLSVPSFIRFGWETFKKRPWYLIGASIAFLVIGWIAGFAVGFVSAVLQVVLGEIFGGIVSFLGSMLVNTLIGMGWIAFFIKAHDDPAAAKLADFWHPQHFFSYVGTTILFVIIVLIGLLLLIVPGIIAALVFMFAPYLVIDKGLGPVAALKESARITKGNRLRLLALMGAVALISLLGLFALIVGLFVAIPVTSLAYINAYRRFSAVAGSARVPLTGGEIGLLIAGIMLPFIAIIGILSSVTLASLSVAREKGREAKVAADLKLLQLGVELYAMEHGSYPSTLSEAAADPDMADTLSAISVEDYSYTAENGSYILCSDTSTPEGSECVTPEDMNSSGVQL